MFPFSLISLVVQNLLLSRNDRYKLELKLNGDFGAAQCGQLLRQPGYRETPLMFGEALQVLGDQHTWKTVSIITNILCSTKVKLERINRKPNRQQRPL